MAVSRVIEVSFGRSSVALVRIDTAYFYNNGIIFKPTDIDLPASYQVHWADSPQSTSTLETIGTAEGAPIPDDLWNRSRVIYGWIYLHPTEDSGITAYEVRIYKNVRAGLPDGTEPTPAEQSTIDQLISALNSAVEQTGQDAESASQSAQSAESAKTAAESARDTAGEYANDAESSAASASTSASQASASATASAQSASQSAQIKADVEGMVDDAQSYAESALIASQASVTARDTAQGYAQSASASAQSASTSASDALTYANTASTKATEASTSAQTASTKATESAQSASQALSYKTDAESAKTASQTAQGLAESARDSAITAKNDAESAKADAESARDEAQQAVASISGALDDKAPVITDTASGSIASFSDGANDLPLKSLTVDINPVQDLHGQDSPWPAGGGKNKFNVFALESKDGLTVNSDGTLTTTKPVRSGKTLAQLAPNLIVGETYKLIVTSSGTRNFYIYLRDIPITWNFGTSKTITQEMLDSEVNFYATAEGVSTTLSDIMIMDSSITDVSYMPYENICPISGWTNINVNHSDADTTNPTTITINLGQTVYGGKLDVLSGKLVIDRTMVDLGTLTYAVNNHATLGQYFYATIAALGVKYEGAFVSRVYNVLCSAYKVVARSPTYLVNGTFCFDGTQINEKVTQIQIKNTAYTDATAFKAAMSGVQLCYELVTPIEIQLTPNQVNSLLGVNNIWADTGDTSCEYRADTKLFIERLTAPDSEDMVADSNITSGQYFMVGNSLYKATANIANGSAIIVGTNAVRKSLSEALNEINA